jgi:thiol:disulfide interchange protein
VASGLVLLAVAAIFLASAIWKSGVLPRWSGVPLAVGFVVCTPQLQGAPLFQPIRIVVGLVIAAGCIWVAAGVARASRTARAAKPERGRTPLHPIEDHGQQQAG